MVLAFSLVVLGLVGWHGDWVLWCMEGAMGVPGLAGGLLGLITLASQCLPLLVLGV